MICFQSPREVPCSQGSSQLTAGELGTSGNFPGNRELPKETGNKSFKKSITCLYQQPTSKGKEHPEVKHTGKFPKDLPADWELPWELPSWELPGTSLSGTYQQ